MIVTENSASCALEAFAPLTATSASLPLRQSAEKAAEKAALARLPAISETQLWLPAPAPPAAPLTAIPTRPPPRPPTEATVAALPAMPAAAVGTIGIDQICSRLRADPHAAALAELPQMTGDGVISSSLDAPLKVK